MFSRICKSFFTLNVLSAPQTFVVSFSSLPFVCIVPALAYVHLFFCIFIILYHCKFLDRFLPLHLHKCIIRFFRFFIFVFYPCIGGRRYCSIGIPISVAVPPPLPLPPLLLSLPCHFSPPKLVQRLVYCFKFFEFFFMYYNLYILNFKLYSIYYILTLYVFLCIIICIFLNLYYLVLVLIIF